MNYGPWLMVCDFYSTRGSGKSCLVHIGYWYFDNDGTFHLELLFILLFLFLVISTILKGQWETFFYQLSPSDIITWPSATLPSRVDLERHHSSKSGFFFACARACITFLDSPKYFKMLVALICNVISAWYYMHKLLAYFYG